MHLQHNWRKSSDLYRFENLLSIYYLCLISHISKLYTIYALYVILEHILGPRATDEMCNLYLMYYSKLDDGGFELCDIEENRNVTKMLSLILNEDIPEDTDRDQFIDDSLSFRSRPNKFVRPDLLM